MPYTASLMPLRILHITPSAIGVPWMVAFMKEQRKAGHDVRAVIAPGKGDLGPKLESEGFEYDVLDFTLFAGSIPAAAMKVARAVRLFRRLRPDILHSHIFEAYMMSRTAGWVADVPIRLAMIPGPYPMEAPVLRLWDGGTAWADTKTIASCEYTRQLYLEFGIPAGQLELAYYAVDQSGLDPALADGARIRRELGIAPGDPVIGKIAYFYPPLNSPGVTPPHLMNRGVKGHDVLLRAVPHVVKEFPNARFVVVGAAFGGIPAAIEYEQFLRDLPRQLGVEENVIFTGERKDVPDLLAAFDLSVHCSLNDNLAGTVESLLMERPMVVSDIGGFADTVLHEKTGLRSLHEATGVGIWLASFTLAYLARIAAGLGPQGEGRAAAVPGPSPNAGGAARPLAEVGS